jgi:hypothetical protein
MEIDVAKPFDEWCVLEIMGHQKFAGRVSEAVIAGQAFIRIDVPERKSGLGLAIPGFTKLFGPSSVYSITPVAEDIARAMAAQLETSAINVYDLPDYIREKLRGSTQRRLPGYDHFEDSELDDGQ